MLFYFFFFDFGRAPGWEYFPHMIAIESLNRKNYFIFFFFSNIIKNSGSSRLYEALMATSQQFSQSDGYSRERLERELENGERIRYIFLFTEGGTCLTEQQTKDLTEQLRANKIGLLIYNISIQNANMLYLKSLTGIVERSSFLVQDDKFDETFKNLREKLIPQQIIIEYF